MKKMKGLYLMSQRIILLCLLFGLFGQILSGCSIPSSPQEHIELWIVTEQTTWDQMNGQIYVVSQAFEQVHENVTIRLDVLPTEEQERTVYLQQLRTQILQGGGPDGYLLPTDNTLILDEPAQYTYVEVEPLFVDVELAMRNGLFYNISSLYDADDTLEKEELNTSIMDAGTVGNARYVLPLRYDIPMIYVQEDAIRVAGLDPFVFTEDIDRIMEQVLTTGNPVLAGGIAYDGFSAFSDLLDYDSGNAVLEETTLVRYMQTYQALQALLGEDILDGTRLESEDQLAALVTENTLLLEKLDLKKYIYCEYGEAEPKPELPDNVIIMGSKLVEEEKLEVLTEYYPLYIGSMTDALAYVPLSIHEESALTIVPMHAMGGDVVATVTYYAALGSGCKNPTLTYEFLRQFLLEDSQWERNRPERNHTKPLKGTAANTSNDLQYPGLIEKGWPVRTRDSLEDLWQSRRKQLYVRFLGFGASETAQRRMRQIGLMGELGEEQVSFADISIDQVRFNTTLSEDFAAVLSQLNDRNHANHPTHADIEVLANQLLWNLRWHVSEG